MFTWELRGRIQSMLITVRALHSTSLKAPQSVFKYSVYSAELSRKPEKLWSAGRSTQQDFSQVAYSPKVSHEILNRATFVYSNIKLFDWPTTAIAFLLLMHRRIVTLAYLIDQFAFVLLHGLHSYSDSSSWTIWICLASCNNRLYHVW